MSKRDKWIKELSNFAGGRKVTCPCCGGSNMNDGYIELSQGIGWGAFWCEDCRQAFALSRVILKDGKVRSKILKELPTDLKFAL